jgi:hypothetical protein
LVRQRTEAGHRYGHAGPGAKDFLPRHPIQQEICMLYTIAMVLVVLWLLGLVTSVTMGGFIHVLLVVAIVVVLLRVISGRRAL